MEGDNYGIIGNIDDILNENRGKGWKIPFVWCCPLVIRRIHINCTPHRQRKYSGRDQNKENFVGNNQNKEIPWRP